MTHPEIVQSTLRSLGNGSAQAARLSDSGLPLAAGVDCWVTSNVHLVATVVGATHKHKTELMGGKLLNPHEQIDPFILAEAMLGGADSCRGNLWGQNHSTFGKRITCVLINPQQSNTSSASELTDIVEEASTNLSLHFRAPSNRKFTWLQTSYFLSSKRQTSKALRAVYHAVEDLLEQRNLFELNHALTIVDLKQLAPEVMIGLIRVTYRVRNNLPAWFDLLEKIRATLKSQEIPDVDLVLSGLTR